MSKFRLTSMQLHTSSNYFFHNRTATKSAKPFLIKIARNEAARKAIEFNCFYNKIWSLEHRKKALALDSFSRFRNCQFDTRDPPFGNALTILTTCDNKSRRDWCQLCHKQTSSWDSFSWAFLNIYWRERQDNESASLVSLRNEKKRFRRRRSSWKGSRD